MVAYTVEPEALRATAGQVQSASDRATAPLWPADGDLGHAGLADAANALTAKSSSSWAARSEELDAIAQRLRSSAEIYERADIESVPGEDVLDG